MLQIQDTLVSLDVAERFFCCDLDACHGACCIEGDAGAPITDDEQLKIQEVLPEVWDELLPRAREEVEKNGVAYIDEEGDLVTTILDGKNCAFTCYAPGGVCLCALERAYREGRTKWKKPASCSAVSAAHHRISYIHGRELSPMEDMPAGRTARTRKRNTRVSVPARAADRTVRTGMVRRTETRMRDLSRRPVLTAGYGHFSLAAR